MRNQHAQNTWVIVTADDPILEFDDASAALIIQPENVLAKIRNDAISKGIVSIRALQVHLRDIDETNSGRLDHDNFRWGLRNYGTPLNNPEDLHVLREAFDLQRDGHIAYKAFLAAIKVRRFKLIIHA